MFERFTDRARQAVVYSQDEARGLNHTWIGTEHILLGLLREGHGVAAQALGGLGISLDDGRREVQAIIGPRTGEPTAHVPFTPRGRRVLELAVRETRILDSGDWVGTGHLLLALIREGDGLAAQILVRQAIDLNLARQQVIQLLSTRPDDIPPPGD